MRYRRAVAPGGTFFFTVDLLVRHVDVLRAVVRDVRRRHPFEIDGWAVLSEHLHAVWTLPPGDADFSTRWMLIKSGFSRRLVPTELVSRSRRRKGERGIWQRRFWEHQIRDESDLERHLDYVHINPVKHGLVMRASEWPWSSIHRYIRSGVMSVDWAAEMDRVARAGERGE